MNPALRKILYIVFWYLLYPQIWYFWLIPELFVISENNLRLYSIMISYIIGILDTLFRPFSENIRGDMETNPLYNYLMLFLFILNPFFIIVAFKEGIMMNIYFNTFLKQAISILGMILLVIGGLITVIGRASLTKFGSGILKIEKDHKLITSGIYGIIRHPIYGGGIIGVIGLFLTFGRLTIMIIVSMLYFIILNHRIIFEEKMLIEEFGEEYTKYMKKTKKIIPYIY